jgi:HTH-type transcriptional repressor of NAD biosynthesis genes
MTTAWVLMTAMPPTVGHGNLIKFANSLDVDTVNVLVCTQPGEPFFDERHKAVKEFAKAMPKVKVHHLHDTLPQDPESPGFWEMWDYILKHPQSEWYTHGAEEGDYFVSSEPYGNTLAKRLKGKFFIYDRDRDLHWTKGTEVREDAMVNFAQILPEFRHNLQVTVTVFGAESTGKTTLAKLLAERLNSQYVFEWARPFMETTSPVIDRQAMLSIFEGQEALQRHVQDIAETPFIIQDTDLFSTIGYWRMPHIEKKLGKLPYHWEKNADRLKSDLYLFCGSGIPFEKDPLRAGGDKREETDEFWQSVLDVYKLPYVVLEDDLDLRLDYAYDSVLGLFMDKTYELRQYDRGGF